METKLIKVDNVEGNLKEIKEVALALRNGELAAIPTETVYGLAANALNEQAVSNIFTVKGRPQDNPLIVHISCIEEIYSIVSDFPKEAKILADRFWPGPMTMVLKRSDKIPASVSAGMDTVAVRMPSHVIARALIKESGVPIAAPSANLSGSPSPTTAKHCVNDLWGKVPYIVDSGECSVGVESTVISLAFGKPIVLRPGGITPEQISEALGVEVELDSAVKGKFTGGQASAPGMKYKHYSPKARVVILEADAQHFCEYVNDHSSEENVYAMCFEEDIKGLKVPSVSLGNKDDSITQAKRLFAALRELDDKGASFVYAHCPSKDGVGLAVYNRLIRSAGFEIIHI